MLKGDPRVITAKFLSFCAETKKPIKKGEECIYYPRHKQVFSMESNQAQTFREWKFDNEVLGQDY